MSNLPMGGPSRGPNAAMQQAPKVDLAKPPPMPGVGGSSGARRPSPPSAPAPRLQTRAVTSQSSMHTVAELVSAGHFYNNNDGTVRFSPAVGQDQMLLAGSDRDDGENRIVTLVELTRKHFDLGGMDIDDLIIHDWMAATFEWMAFSMGRSVVSAYQECPHCGEVAAHAIELRVLPCRRLRVAMSADESVTWPDELTVEEEQSNRQDRMLELMRKMDEERRAVNPVDHTTSEPSKHLVVSAEAAEPFTAHVEGIGDIEWAFARVSDFLFAFRFAREFGLRGKEASQTVSLMLMAAHMRSVNGKRVTINQAYELLSQMPMTAMTNYNEEISRYDLGYNFNPVVVCKSKTCSRRFTGEIALSADTFRL